MVGVMVEVGASANEDNTAMVGTNARSLFPEERRSLTFVVNDIADTGLVGHWGVVMVTARQEDGKPACPTCRRLIYLSSSANHRVMGPSICQTLPALGLRPQSSKASDQRGKVRNEATDPSSTKMNY